MAGKNIIAILIISVILIFCLVPTVLAHVPSQNPGTNDSLNSAINITDPEKSYVIYSELQNINKAQYYKMELDKGENLQASLIIPVSEKGIKLPVIALMGPGLPRNDTAPKFVELENNSNVMIFSNLTIGSPQYEPFTPSTFYDLVNINMNVAEKGVYYIAVYDNYTNYNYALTVGYQEKFTVTEWLLIPFSVISVYQWEGQPMYLVFAPLILTIILGLVVLNWKRPGLFNDLQTTIGIMSGLLFLGDSIMYLSQMVYSLSSAVSSSILITTIFFVIPFILGILIIRIMLKKDRILSTNDMISLFIIGILGLIFWGGLIFGPSLAIITIILPPIKPSSKPLRVVPYVDLERYTGRWYEIAKFPNRFQKNCINTTATYKKLPDGTIEVLNACKRNNIPTSIKGKAKVIGKKTNAILKVKFFGPFGGNYWIIDLGESYDYAVVSEPSRLYLWILYRAKKMDDELYNEIIEKLKKQDFDVDKIIKTKHE